MSTSAGAAPGRASMLERWRWSAGRAIVYLTLMFLYRLRQSGSEHVPRSGGYIIAANHQSHFDPLLVGVVTYRRPFTSLARSSLFHFGPLAWLMRLFGAVALEQGRGDTAAFRAALDALTAGRPVLIFPEGTRTRSGAIMPFKRGVELLIRRAGVPVLPVALDGAHEIWPIGRSLPSLRGRLAVAAGRPIPAEELLRDGADGALERLRREIELIRLPLRDQLRRSSRGRHPTPDAGDVPYWKLPAAS